MMNANRMTILALLLLLPGISLANNTPTPTPEPEPTPPPTATSTSTAGAESTSAADAAADADARAAALAKQQQAAIAKAEGGAGGEGGESAADAKANAEGGSGVGTVDSSTRVRSFALAVNIPAATPAPAVQGVCLTHSRGSAFGWGAYSRSGGTKLDPQCSARQHCLAIADRLASWNLIEGATRQLAMCEGVKVDYIPPPVFSSTPPVEPTPPPDLAPYATKDEVKALDEKVNRIFKNGLGK